MSEYRANDEGVVLDPVRLPAIANTPSRSRETRAVCACAAAYGVVTLFIASRAPLWRDEVYTLRTTDHGPWEAARRAITYDLQAPGYFVVEAAWRMLFAEPWLARIPSVVFGAATVFVGTAVFTRMVPSLRARWGGVLIASSPLLIWAGSEARWSSLAILMGGTFTWLLIRVHVEGWTRGRAWLVVCGTACLYTNYYLGFLLVSGGIGLLLLRDRRDIVRYLIEMAFVLALFAPLAAIVAQQVGARTGGAPSSTLTVAGALFSVESSAWNLSFGTNALMNSDVLAKAMRWLTRILFIGGLAAHAMRAQGEWRHQLATPLLAAISTAISLTIGSVVTSALGLPWPHHYASIFFVTAFSMPILIASGFGQRISMITLLVLVASNLSLAYLEHRSLGRCGNSIAVARTLEHRVATSESVLVVPADALLSLEMYYRGTKKLEPVPGPPNSEVWRLSDMLPKGPDDLATVLHRAGNPTSFWLYSEFPGLDQRLEEWTGPAWRKIEHLQFEGGRYTNGDRATAHLRHFVRESAHR